MKYREYKSLNYAGLEAEVLAFWKENKIFEKSVSSREGREAFVFYEGPPSANGMPGIHHVMARTIKDIFCRYKTLQGFQVERKAGWDTHGLPVELQVEKELHITKDDIGVSISVEAYNQKCRETVMKYTDVWEQLTEKMGYWVDMSDPYITYKNDYIETVWYLLKQLHDKNLLYKGYTIQPFSPKAGTGLSSHELNLPGCYKDVTDTSITAQFKVKNETQSNFLFENPEEDLRILAWTTTPWTLPSNCALAVGEKIKYVKVKTFNPYTYQPVSVILAKDLVSKHFNEKAKDIVLEDFKAGDKLIPYLIVAEYTGKQLEGVHYFQMMPYITNKNLETNGFRVIIGDFVTTEDGTGIVHTASVFGADDFRVSQQNNIPPVMIKDAEGNEVPLVTRQGRFVQELKDKMNVDLRQIAEKLGKNSSEYDLPEYMKSEYEEAPMREGYLASDVLISILLKEQNKAFKVEKYVHSYPHCWRTDKPILYYPLDSWFIRTTAMKDKLVALNETINWKPASTGTGRFGNWLGNLVDWNLSRQRYWGIPLPIWRTEDGKEEKCIGSVEELQKETAKANAALKQNSPDLNDLHRPFVDEVILVSDSGKPMYREKDLIDVWFDSGAMPYAQQHYMGGGLKSFPADFISEGVDQTRGWFFTLHAIAGILFDSVAFKNVVSTGLVLDQNGEKMSKRKGNIVEPFHTKKYLDIDFENKKTKQKLHLQGEYEIEGALSKYGVDPTRWYMIGNANPWDNLKFSWESTVDEENKKIYGNSDGISEVQRSFFGTLYNTYNFFALYANIDDFNINEMNIVPVENRPELDRWILSLLQDLILEVTKQLDDYEPTKAVRAIEYFTDSHLSNWYVRLSRKRFWKGEMTTDKKAAYETLHECLLVVAQLMSPIAPFFSEWLYKNMTDGVREFAQDNETPLQYDSIHLTNLVKAEKNLIDKDLEERMDLAQRICSLSHSLRKKANVRVRQPLSKILIPILDEKVKHQIESVKEIIFNEVNVKDIDYVADDSGLVVKSVKPNFKTLGVKYKQQMKEVTTMVNGLSKEEISQIEKKGSLQKEDFLLVLEDLLIMSEDMKGFSVASENGLTVALDIEISDALRLEGIARDFVNRIQNLRKDSGLEVMDKIAVRIQSTEAYIQKAVEEYKDYICLETQALSLELASQLDNVQEVEIDVFSVGLQISIESPIKV